MLLPLMLRTLIEGSALQGSTSQRELEHVRHGLDGTSQLPGSEGLAAPPNTKAQNSSSTSSSQVLSPNNDGKDARNPEELLHSSSMDTDTNERDMDMDLDQRTRKENVDEHIENVGQGRGTGTDGNKNRGAIKIGFFLHTPFPSSEIYR